MRSYHRPYFESQRERDRGFRERDSSSARRRYGRRDDDDDRGPWISRDREPFEPDFDPRENEFRERGHYAGRGPKGYQRSDERLKEEVCEQLTADSYVDASEVDVSVQNSEVTLEGTVRTRRMKRAAEDCVESISGVQQVHNRLRVESSDFDRDEGEFSSRFDDGQRSSAGRKAH
jgi:BON domain-containing protein